MDIAADIDQEAALARKWMTNLVPVEEYFDVKDKPYVIFHANEYSQWRQRAMVIDGTPYNCCE